MAKGWKPTLSDVFSQFNKRSVSYCIIRNHQFLQTTRFYEGKDIDILLLKKDIKSVRQILKPLGFVELAINKLSNHLAFSKYIAEDRRFVSLHFHIGHVSGAFLPYYVGNTLLKRRLKQGHAYVSNPLDECAILILHSILNKRNIKSKYLPRIKTLLRKCSFRDLESAFTFAIGKSAAHQLANDCTSQNFTNIQKNISKIIKAHQFKDVRRILRLRTQHVLQFVWAFRRLFKLAPVLSVIGMDGAGKTTSTNYLENTLSKSLIKTSRIYFGRGKNNLLPIQKVASPLARKRKHMSSKLKNFLRGASAPLFALDLWFRYYFKILPKRITHSLIITDRYSTDILLMKNTPATVRKILFSLLPKANKTLYLYNDPTILHARKQHPLNDLYRQKKEFSRILNRIPHTKIRSETVDVTTKAVLDETWKLIHQTYKY